MFSDKFFGDILWKKLFLFSFWFSLLNYTHQVFFSNFLYHSHWFTLNFSLFVSSCFQRKKKYSMIGGKFKIFLGTFFERKKSYLFWMKTDTEIKLKYDDTIKLKNDEKKRNTFFPSYFFLSQCSARGSKMMFNAVMLSVEWTTSSSMSIRSHTEIQNESFARASENRTSVRGFSFSLAIFMYGI